MHSYHTCGLFSSKGMKVTTRNHYPMFLDTMIYFTLQNTFHPEVTLCRLQDIKIRELASFLPLVMKITSQKGKVLNDLP